MAIKELAESLIREFPGFQLATRLCCQDSVENFFAKVRKRGGDSPTARTFRLTVRHICATKDISASGRGNVCAEENQPPDRETGEPVGTKNQQASEFNQNQKRLVYSDYDWNRPVDPNVVIDNEVCEELLMLSIATGWLLDNSDQVEREDDPPSSEPDAEDETMDLDD